MRKTRSPYPTEFRHKMIELVRAGCTPEELAKEFKPHMQTIQNWVAQVERDTGLCQDGFFG